MGSNRNATAVSSHEFGTTFDINYNHYLPYYETRLQRSIALGSRRLPRRYGVRLRNLFFGNLRPDGSAEKLKAILARVLLTLSERRTHPRDLREFPARLPRHARAGTGDHRSRTLARLTSSGSCARRARGRLLHLRRSMPIVRVLRRGCGARSAYSDPRRLAAHHPRRPGLLLDTGVDTYVAPSLPTSVQPLRSTGSSLSICTCACESQSEAGRPQIEVTPQVRTQHGCYGTFDRLRVSET